jgi:hypothetical protein
MLQRSIQIILRIRKAICVLHSTSVFLFSWVLLQFSSKREKTGGPIWRPVRPRMWERALRAHERVFVFVFTFPFLYSAFVLFYIKINYVLQKCTKISKKCESSIVKSSSLIQRCSRFQRNEHFLNFHEHFSFWWTILYSKTSHLQMNCIAEHWFAHSIAEHPRQGGIGSTTSIPKYKMFW